MYVKYSSDEALDDVLESTRPRFMIAIADELFDMTACLFQDFMVGALAKARGVDLDGAKSVVDTFFSGYERRVAAEASPEERHFFYFSLQRK
jgi:hypothetical protein